MVKLATIIQPTVFKLPKSLAWIKLTEEYRLIRAYYGRKRAKRTGVPWINHIHEGLVLLDNINLDEDSKKAFCLHPIDQSDLWDEVFIKAKGIDEDDIDIEVMELAQEFTSTANAYLNCSPIPKNGIKLNENKKANDMLLADKVQNYKDFIKYHKDTHPRSKELDAYFRRWLEALGIDFERYEILAQLIK